MRHDDEKYRVMVRGVLVCIGLIVVLWVGGVLDAGYVVFVEFGLVFG